LGPLPPPAVAQPESMPKDPKAPNAEPAPNVLTN
jgi:hypothetical protein